ncbi:hypothetical protein [Polaromonas sp. CG9_12]|nr:hypothetical protein [Polaromonas sp. CG9_12]
MQQPKAFIEHRFLSTGCRSRARQRCKSHVNKQAGSGLLTKNRVNIPCV